MRHQDNDVVLAEALFVSSLDRRETYSDAAIRRAVIEALRRNGVRECVAQVAQEYGEHPDTAAARMKWALACVTQAYERASPG
jgi:hypothetical protein